MSIHDPRTASGSEHARPRAIGGKYFLGPLPLDWLTSAARLPGKSLHVGVALWYSAELSRSSVVLLSNIHVSRFGLDRNAKYRALQCLEEAGLVQVERKLGRSPQVTILGFRGEP
jgi:hypothetical protein